MAIITRYTQTGSFRNQLRHIHIHTVSDRSVYSPGSLVFGNVRLLVYGGRRRALSLR